MDCSFCVLQRGRYLSEPALWTKWQHQGTFTSNENGTLLALDAVAFFQIISQYDSACAYALKYAKHYLWNLSRLHELNAVSDILEYDFARELWAETLYSPHDHLVFISHFKAEAGTEATLIQEALEARIRLDAGTPASEF